MKGREALEKLYDGFQNGMAGRSFYEIIKQELDRLEKLEYVLLLIVDYGLIDLKSLEKFMNDEELEAMQKAFKEAEEKIEWL